MFWYSEIIMGYYKLNTEPRKHIYGKNTKINIYQNSKHQTHANFNEITKVTYE